MLNYVDIFKSKQFQYPSTYQAHPPTRSTFNSSRRRKSQRSCTSLASPLETHRSSSCTTGTTASLGETWVKTLNVTHPSSHLWKRSRPSTFLEIKKTNNPGIIEESRKKKTDHSVIIHDIHDFNPSLYHSTNESSHLGVDPHFGCISTIAWTTHQDCHESMTVKKKHWQFYSFTQYFNDNRDTQLI